jgi:DNA-binding response OmpR family regulator
MAQGVILVCDDNEQNVELLEAQLTAIGYTVIPAVNGQAAMDLVFKDRPDLLLLDIMMPGITGFDVIKALRADPVTATIPIVVLTSLQEFDDKIKAMELGADDFLSKPYNKLELFARIKSLLRIKRLRDEVSLQSEELARKNEDLRKLTALKDSLITVVANDLKTPLLQVIGNLDIVLSGRIGELDNEQTEVLQSAKDDCDRMLSMVLDLLKVRTR